MNPEYLVGWVRVEDLELFANVRGTLLEHDAVWTWSIPRSCKEKTDRQRERMGPQVCTDGRGLRPCKKERFTTVDGGDTHGGDAFVTSNKT